MRGTEHSGLKARGGRATAAVLACLSFATVTAACGDDAEEPMAAVVKAEPGAGRWKTWVLSSGAEIAVPAPPAEDSEAAEADLEAVKDAADKRTSATQEIVDKWSGPLPTRPWTQLAFDFVSRQAKNPPLSSRNYALVHVAMYDATIAAYNAKYTHNVKAPEGVSTLVPAGSDPSYPSEHAAIAGAASKVLAFLYPSESALRLDEMADQAGDSRVQAGTNTPSDVSAGLDLGRAVADKVIAYAKTDGAGKAWDGQRPPGIGRGPRFWEPPPGSASPPIDPPAGTWKPWVMSSGSQFRPGPPPAFGSADFRAAAQEIVDIKKNLTQQQKDVAKYWEGAAGTPLPAGITLNLAMGDIENAAATGDMATRWTIPRSTRALALVNIAMSDGGVSVWDAKFTYWNPRPENGIRDLGLDRNWSPHLPTPIFPAYPSGSAGYAGATQQVMTYLFPDKAAEFERRAKEQAESRLFAGIHWRYDAISVEGGRKVADLVIARAKADGADG